MAAVRHPPTQQQRQQQGQAGRATRVGHRLFVPLCPAQHSTGGGGAPGTCGRSAAGTCRTCVIPALRSAAASFSARAEARYSPGRTSAASCSGTTMGVEWLRGRAWPCKPMEAKLGASKVFRKYISVGWIVGLGRWWLVSAVGYHAGCSSSASSNHTSLLGVRPTVRRYRATTPSRCLMDVFHLFMRSELVSPRRCV